MDLSKARLSANIEDRRHDWTNVQSGHSFREDDSDDYTDIGTALRIMLGDTTYNGGSTIQEDQIRSIYDYYNDYTVEPMLPAEMATLFSNELNDDAARDPADIMKWIDLLRSLENLPEGMKGR